MAARERPARCMCAAGCSDISASHALLQVRILFSGHEVPGEGEHKIVSYIRSVRCEPGYDPNTRHCMAGLDADLIMLALATHEPHFTLLREQVDFMSFKKNAHGTKTATRETKEKKWQLMHIGLLREYLEVDMRPAHPIPFAYDAERAVDDFVLVSGCLQGGLACSCRAPAPASLAAHGRLRKRLPPAPALAGHRRGRHGHAPARLP